MTGAEREARRALVAAVGRLAGEGLIQRTWGNISLRLSEEAFLITPSGLAYENLREEQLVRVRVGDGSYTGRYKPSSEWRIHADAYRLRPGAGFVIHTHQHWASVAGVTGRALTGFSHPRLGKRIPCAAYGLPGTEKLRRAVSEELESWPDCDAVLLRRHGALCLGRDGEDAFAAARALEEVCETRVRAALEGLTLPPAAPDLGSSRRRGDAFVLTLRGERSVWHIGDRNLPPEAALHGAIYRTGPYQYIAHEAAPAVTAASAGGRVLRPYLDDLAQMAGAELLCVPPEPRWVELGIRGRNAVLLRGGGALCAAGTEDDRKALRALLRKGCAAWIYARSEPGCRPLSPADARLQRLVYQRSYQKKRNAAG